MKTIAKILLGFLGAVFIAILTPIIILLLGLFFAIVWAFIEFIFILGMLWLLGHLMYEKLFKSEMQKTDEQSGEETQNV